MDRPCPSTPAPVSTDPCPEPDSSRSVRSPSGCSRGRSTRSGPRRCPCGTVPRRTRCRPCAPRAAPRRSRPTRRSSFVSYVGRLNYLLVQGCGLVIWRTALLTVRALRCRASLRLLQNSTACGLLRRCRLARDPSRCCPPGGTSSPMSSPLPNPGLSPMFLPDLRSSPKARPTRPTRAGGPDASF